MRIIDELDLLIDSLDESLGLSSWMNKCVPEKSDERSRNWYNVISVGRLLDVIIHNIEEDGNPLTPQEERGLLNLKNMSKELIRIGKDRSERTNE